MFSLLAALFLTTSLAVGFHRVAAAEKRNPAVRAFRACYRGTPMINALIADLMSVVLLLLIASRLAGFDVLRMITEGASP